MRTRTAVVGIVFLTLAFAGISVAGETPWKQTITRASDLYSQGKTTDALSEAYAALAFARKTYGENSINMVKSLELAAELNRAQGNYGEAGRLLNAALTIQEKTIGLSAPRLVKTVCSLAKVHADQKSLFEARALYMKALALCEQQGRGDTPTALTPMMGLAKLQKNCGKNEECRVSCQRMLNICHAYRKYQPTLALQISETESMLAEIAKAGKPVAKTGSSDPANL